MYERKIAEDLDCGIVIAMKVFGAKWKPCIIDAIGRGISRPSEIHRSIGTATPRVIEMQLSELEHFGVVARQVYAGFPLRSDYTLTPLGKSILPILAMLDQWGLKNMALVKEKLGQVHTIAAANACITAEV